MENSILIILFLAVFLKNSVFWASLWQIKEYRLDRFVDYLSTPEGQRSFFNKSFAWELLTLVVLLINANNLAGINLKILLVAFTLELMLWLYQFKRKEYLKPVWTGKSLLIISLAVLFACLISVSKINSFPENFLTSLVTINLLTSLWIGLSILLIYPLSHFLKKRKVAAAKAKIAGAAHLKIVGITGSYGKTSVKEFTYSLLKDLFKTAKTEKNNNTEMGVAQTILSKDLSATEIFIVEMGAYKIGEIKKICLITPPNIAVLTGIDEQHGALFGGLENTKKAKSEILMYACPGGTAILNYQNQHVHDLRPHPKLKQIAYALDNRTGDLQGHWTGQENSWQIFTASYHSQTQLFKTKLIGEHNLLNILAALAVALALGKRLEEMISAVAALQPPPETMEILAIGQLKIINDSYNANPTGVLAAVKTLAGEAGEKIIVLDDILELGKKTFAIHQKIAANLVQADFSKVILVGKNYPQMVRDEMVQLGAKSENILVERANPQAVAKYLASLAATASSNQLRTILFEGRRAKKHLNLLLNSQ